MHLKGYTMLEMSQPELVERFAGEDAELIQRVRGQVEQFHPTYLVLYEMQALDSRNCGQLLCVPIGGSATLQALPERLNKDHAGEGCFSCLQLNVPQHWAYFPIAFCEVNHESGK